MAENNIVVIGIANGKHGKPKGTKLYMNIDPNSGGYPYWTTSPGRAQTYDSVERALRAANIEYMHKEATDIKVATIEYVTTPVQSVTADLTKYIKQLGNLDIEIAQAAKSLDEAVKRGNHDNIVEYSALIARLGVQRENVRNTLTALGG